MGDSSDRIKRRRTRTRGALLDVAERAFMRDGYHAVRLETIAQEADVSMASIYNLFSGKEGLYLAAAERASELFADYVERAFSVSDSPLEQVMACGDAYLRFHLEHPGAFRFIAFDGVESTPAVGDEDLRQSVTDRTLVVLARFRDAIAAAVDAGEASARIDPDLTSRLLFGAWNGIVALSLRRDDLAHDDDAITALIDQTRWIVVEGLTDPRYRGSDGHSRARLLAIAEPESDDAESSAAGS